MFLTTTIVSCAVLFGAPVPASTCDLSSLAVSANESINGTVQSADLTGKRFTVQTENGETREVSWNDETIFMLDGEKSDAKSVLVTMGKIRATLGEDSVATNVSRWSE